jgi:uncharacterized OB-fold protein
MSYQGPLNRPAAMPMPNDDAVEAGFWRAAAENRLDIQRCNKCDAHRNPPSCACIHCGSPDWRWDTVPGTGTIMTYVWIPDPARQGRSDLPSPYYNLAVVELDGTVGTPSRVVTNILDAWQINDLQVGQRVELRCVKLSEAVGLPGFTRIRAEE